MYIYILKYINIFKRTRKQQLLTLLLRSTLLRSLGKYEWHILYVLLYYIITLIILLLYYYIYKCIYINVYIYVYINVYRCTCINAHILIDR